MKRLNDEQARMIMKAARMAACKYGRKYNFDDCMSAGIEHCVRSYKTYRPRVTHFKKWAYIIAKYGILNYLNSLPRMRGQVKKRSIEAEEGLSEGLVGVLLDGYPPENVFKKVEDSLDITRALKSNILSVAEKALANTVLSGELDSLAEYARGVHISREAVSERLQGVGDKLAWKIRGVRPPSVDIKELSTETAKERFIGVKIGDVVWPF